MHGTKWLWYEMTVYQSFDTAYNMDKFHGIDD